jgi:hypothetical protein
MAGENSDTTHDVTLVAPGPPGVDQPPGGTLRQVLAPHGRAIAVLAAVTLAVAVTLLITLPRPHGDAVRVVDTAPAVAAASKVPGFPVYVPDPLPAGWHADSVRFDHPKAGAHLHIGYLAPDGGYVGLEETNGLKVYTFVTSMSAGAVFRGFVTIDGTDWTRLSSDRKTQDSVVWYGTHSVVVVTGTTSLANLELLAASLHVGR